MMKFIFKNILYITIFIALLLIFLPKSSFYYLLENELEKNRIIISNEVLTEKYFSLDIHNAKIFFEGINVALIKKAKVQTYLVFNKLNVEDIKVLDSLKHMVPSKIKNIQVIYSILNFNKLKIEANGDFGTIEGYINLLDRNIYINLNASNIMKNNYSQILNKMNLKDGRYIYEYKF